MKNLILVIIVFISFNSVAQVTSVTGTADQVITSGSTGAVTLSLPQSIGTASSPQFSKLVIGGPVNVLANFYNNKNIEGATSAYGNLTQATIQSGVTSAALGYRSILSTQAASFVLPSLTHYAATQGTIGAGSTVASQYGYRAENSLIGANNNYGFWGGIPSGANRWNLYMDGTAKNYLAGSTGFGVVNPTYQVEVNGIIKLSGNLFLGTTGSQSVGFYNSKDITGNSTSHGNITTGIIQSDVTVNAFGYRSWLSTQAAAFNIGSISHYSAGMQTIGTGSTMSNLYGYVAESTLVGAAGINAGFRGKISAASGRWNLYMDGTTDNYLAGNLGIGTTTPAEKLSVNGNIRSKEVKVESANWPDYVFHKTYSLQSLSEVEKFIKTNQHLPGIPSAAEVEKDGLNLGEMNAKLLEKIEELTLYLISQEKRLDEQSLLIRDLQEKTGISKK